MKDIDPIAFWKWAHFSSCTALFNGIGLLAYALLDFLTGC